MSKQPRKQYLLSSRKVLDQANAGLASPTQEKSRSLSQNIFQLKGENQVFQEFHGGPKYDRNGTLVERSIVGKAEAFNKLRNMSLHSIKFMNPQTNTDQIAQKFISRLSTKRLSMISLKTQSSIKSVLDPSQTDLPVKEKSKRNKDFDVYDKEDMLIHLRQTMERIRKNELQQQAQTNQLDFREKLQSTREQRILSKYQEQQRIWNGELHKLISQTNRDVNDSVFYNSQSFRKKIEKVEYQEAVKILEGQQTVNQWYMTLRHQPEHMRVPSEGSCKQKVFQDVNNNFTTLVVDSTMKPLEVIHQSSFYGAPPKILSPPQKHKSGGYMLQTKRLPFFKHTRVQEEDLDALQVSGANVLKMESEQVLEAPQHTQFRFYKLPQIPEAETIL